MPPGPAGISEIILGQLPGPTCPQPSLLELQLLLSPEPTRPQGRGETGSLAGPAGRKAQGQLLRGCPQLWFWMNEPSSHARYFTSGRNTFLEQSKDRGGEKEMFSRLFSTTQPSQRVFKVPWPEAAVSDPKLVLLLCPPPLSHPPTVGASEESAGWWQMEIFF